MPKSTFEFLSMMDERLWFRMIVCFLPGLVLAKLGGYANANSVFSLFATLILVAGVGIYAFWGRLRRSSTEPDADDEFIAEEQTSGSISGVAGPADDATAQEQIALLAQLRSLCREESRESDKLIEMEIAVNPQITFAQAVGAAITRRRILSK